jgi:hypothetical protein
MRVCPGARKLAGLTVHPDACMDESGQMQAMALLQ